MLVAEHAVSDRDNATGRRNGVHVYCLELQTGISNYDQLIGQWYVQCL